MTNWQLDDLLKLKMAAEKAQRKARKMQRDADYQSQLANSLQKSYYVKRDELLAE